MANILDIDNSKIPYRAKIKFTNGIFELRFRWLKHQDRIYVDLYNDVGDLIHENEKLVFGIPLFFPILEDVNKNLNPNYPDKYIIPSSKTGQEFEVNLSNLSENIFLVLQDRN